MSSIKDMNEKLNGTGNAETESGEGTPVKPQRFLGGAVAAASSVGFRTILARSWPIILTLLVVITALMIKTSWDAKERRALNAEHSREIAEANSIKAAAERDSWKSASQAQNKRLETLELKLETMNVQMKERDARFTKVWDTVATDMRQMNNRAEALIAAPTAPASQEVPVTRSKLKDTKEYKLK